MGKKDKRPRKEAFDNEEEDNQIVEGMAVDDEEVAAVLAMRREKAQATLSGDSSEVKSIGKVEINGADGIGSEGIKTNVNYNKAALVQAVTSLNTSTLPFKETYRICEFGFEFTDENDDLAREMAFYEHTLQAVKFGRNTLKSLGIPAIRPSDYFCEHVKSDEHMARVKDRLILEEKKIEAFEQRKQRDFDRKFSKKVSSTQKKVKTNDSAANKDFTDSNKFGRNNKYTQNTIKDEKDSGERGTDPRKSLKRKNMDKKYGFGGKDRKKAKLNDFKSLNDLTEFNPRGGKYVRRENKFKGSAGPSRGKFGANKKGGNRPGKEARSKIRKSKA